ncbi:MAG: hypothetical protein IRZ29_02670, partial [Thermoflavifilum sp.]|nr:hypothetical protein [Thermoflavifilum sp.]
LGLYLKGGYFWQQPYSFPVRQRNISKVNFNLSPREIQYQLSNPQIAPFETHNYAIPHQFFFGQIGLSLVIKTKSSTIHSVHEPSGYTETRTVMPAQQPHPQQAFRIVLDEPRPHAVFRSINDIPAFRWHVEGTPPPQAQYQIEIFQLDENGTVTARVASGIVQPNRPFMIPAEEKSRMQLSRKNSYYSWKVTETTTGHSSGEPPFSVQTASCGTVIDSIMISCDGWDAQTGLPKYQVQICLKNTPTTNTTGCQANYTSITSSPTNAGTISNLTNLPVYISPNQTACISFTYTPSSLSQATAYFVVHGNWNDALQNTVNILSGDSLPSCICHDCDSMQIQINQTQVQASASDPHLFDITGQVLVNPQAIHALAFSIQSFSFTANPGGCAVVDSIEHDGMILSSGTTVNGSTANLVFGNAPAGNPNVFKLLKWISSPPVPAGVPVPFHLVVSLPAASSGLDPSCCQIQYQICLEVKVYYDACRYCTRTICLNFSNQKP